MGIKPNLKFIKQALILFSFLCTPSLLVKADDQYHFTTDEPIYVVGDVHGDYASIVATLKTLKLIDSNNNWIGGKAHFVGLGDIMDRGPHSRKIMDLYIQLQEQSLITGGRFHFVLGNHEVMNLVGDLRYLSQEEIAEFAADKDDSVRNKEYQRFIKLNNIDDNEASRIKFNESFPDGFFARKHAFSRKGYYGKWLLQQPLVIQINDQIFMHGGMSELVEKYTLSEWNQQLRRDLKSYLRSWENLRRNHHFSATLSYFERKSRVNILANSKSKSTFLVSSKSPLFSEKGPTWFRGNAFCHPFFERDNLSKRLSNWNAKKLWVGHTTTKPRKPLNRLGDMLTIMDTGMLKSHYKGEPWVAKINTGYEPTYIHGLSGIEGEPAQALNRYWENKYDMSDSELETFLSTADISEIGSTEEGVTKPIRVLLRKGNRELKGLFKYVDTDPKLERGRWNTRGNYSDRYQFEMAAYTLDRILGIGLVPVTVEREFQGKTGVLQLWINNLISKKSMKDKHLPYDGFCSKKDQDNLIDTWDILIANRDRNQSNILYDKQSLEIWFIDHSRAFDIKVVRPKMLKKVKLELTPRFREALETLNLENLNVLKKWLHKKQIRALIKRRNAILKNS